MPKHRKRPRRERALVSFSVLGTATVATGLLIGPSSADPPPSIDEVKQDVERLEHESVKAVEDANVKREKVRDMEDELKQLASDLDKQQEQVDKLRRSVGANAAAEYRTGGTDPTVKLLTSENPDEFLAQMTSSRAIQSQQADMLRTLQTEQKQLDERRSSHQATMERMKEAKQDAVSRMKDAKAKVKKAEELLERLTEEQQQRLRDQRASRGGDRGDESAPPPPDGNGRGATVVEFARAQLGEPYVMGTSGPDTWDCSGLTMAAWAEAGVSLAHSSSTQASQGTPVSESELQPGDLIIYYDDMSHVGIYAGDGQMIHAPNSNSVVKYDDIDIMPITAMVRPG